MIESDATHVGKVWRPERYDNDMISSRSLSSKRRLRASLEFDEKYGDEKKLLHEITSLNDEKATLEEQVENFMEQVLGPRKELSTAREAVVRAGSDEPEQRRSRHGDWDAEPGGFIQHRPPPSDNLRRYAQSKTSVEFLRDIRRSFKIRCQEIGWLRDGQPHTDGWSVRVRSGSYVGQRGLGQL
jgi:hypothetical protein